jgi:signal transduction histidine kinase
MREEIPYDQNQDRRPERGVDPYKREKKERKERMSSIARKINWSFWRSKVVSYILFDMFLFAVLAAFDTITTINSIPGGWREIAGFSFGRDPQNAMAFVFSLKDGTFFYRKVRPIVEFLVPVFSAIGFFQFFSLFFSMFRTGRIRRKLQPLNDLASRAEVISNIPLDATHLENLERAIRGVDGTEENVRIETQDKDLQGIENALNGLLSRMKEAQMQQTRFVSDASHELRTPIAVVQGYVNMLDRWGKEDPAVLNESIEALKHESQYMKDLVEQLLFLARGDSGRNILKIVNIDLKEIVREVFEESIMIDADHDYRFTVQGVDCGGENEQDSALILSAAPRMMIRGDVSMIKQSLRIFVQNAAKYTAKGNTITLGVTSSNGFVSYVVQDEGTGIEAEDLKHIFERFYRSDKARNGKTGGSGLGLSIAKWIVDAHEGRVDVISRTELGTRFTVSFPESHVAPGPESGMKADFNTKQATSVTQPKQENSFEKRANTAPAAFAEAEPAPERVEAEIIAEPAGNLVGVRMEPSPGIELVLEPKIEKIENPFVQTGVPGFGAEPGELRGFEQNDIT